MFKKLLVIGSYSYRVRLNVEKEQRLRFSIYRLQYCWSVCVCVCVYFKKPTSHEYAFTCIIEKTAYLLSWAQRLNAGASGCGQPACSQF